MPPRQRAALPLAQWALASALPALGLQPGPLAQAGRLAPFAQRARRSRPCDYLLTVYYKYRRDDVLSLANNNI